MLKPLITFLLVCALAPGTFAQQKSDGTQKFKPPKVRTFLGGYQNKDSINPATGKLILSLPLQIMDSAQTEYKIENYRFVYRRKGFLQNEKTGKPEVNFTITAGVFTETPLPSLWIENVGLHLLEDEELYFFDIIVQDKKGNRFLAPDLKLVIKK